MNDTSIGKQDYEETPLRWGLSALLLLCCSLWRSPPMPALRRRRAPPKIDSGDTAWMLTSTALVLLMTIPGLALFYAGMVRKKNILATMMQSFTICCIVTIVWTVAGYSIAFTTGNEYIGDFSRIMLNGIADHIVKGNDSQAFVLASGIKDVADMAHDDPRNRLHDVPDDLRDHHPGADRRRVRRSHEVLGDVHLHDAVVAAGLLADRALGLGAVRLGQPDGRARLRRRHRRAHQRRYRRPGVRAGAWQAGRLRHRQHGAVQPAPTP